VGPRAGLDGCRKFRPRRDSIPGPSSPYQVAIQTELSRPITVRTIRTVTHMRKSSSAALKAGIPQMSSQYYRMTISYRTKIGKLKSVS
jgi:hypothetical protein